MHMGAEKLLWDSTDNMSESLLSLQIALVKLQWKTEADSFSSGYRCSRITQRVSLDIHTVEKWSALLWDLRISYCILGVLNSLMTTLVVLYFWCKYALIYMSHFSYVCKMQCPLNLVLESWEYLWFYLTFLIAILDCGLKLHKLSIHTLVMLQKWLEIY